MWPFANKKKVIEELEVAKFVSEQESIEEKEIEKMVNTLKKILDNTSKEIVFLCIGSDRSTGDSLGPLVGTMLNEKNFSFPVYGTLQLPVHALNMKQVLKNIHDTYEDPFIIGIDASLGDERKIGTIFIREGAFIPGKSLNKGLPAVGDCHMKAVVNYLDPWDPYQSLSSTRLYTVLKLAEIMTKIIIRSVTFEKDLRSH